MRTPVLLLSGFLIFLTAAAPRPLLAGSSSTLTPTNAPAERVTVGTKPQSYFRLKPKGSLRLEVEGPGTVTIFSRAVLDAGHQGKAVYALVIREGAKEVQRTTVRADRSRGGMAGKEPLGELRKTRLKLPAGKHTLEVLLENTRLSAAMLKFSLTKSRTKVKRAPLEARASARVVTAVVREKFLTYYTATAQKKADLWVIGPTRLRVSTRLNYDASMKGNQTYSVGVWEGGKRILLKRFSTSKALGVFYREWGEVTPGKVKSFSLDVPPGQHRYAFALEKGLAQSVSFRFAIPQRDLGNEQ